MVIRQMDSLREYITYRPSTQLGLPKMFISLTNKSMVEPYNSSVADLTYPGLFLTLVGLVK